MSFKAHPWLRFFCVYIALMLAENLIWEVAQLPLYTIWEKASFRETAFAVVHCTIGDALIATITLRLALVVTRSLAWPHERFWKVGGISIVMGVSYTIFSEWFNTVVRESWTYSNQMPIIALFGLRLGISPLLQWVLIPFTALILTRRITAEQ